jgi:hypothetical protein
MLFTNNRPKEGCQFNGSLSEIVHFFISGQDCLPHVKLDAIRSGPDSDSVIIFPFAQCHARFSNKQNAVMRNFVEIERIFSNHSQNDKNLFLITNTLV